MCLGKGRVYTSMLEVEFIVNSRPLTVQSEEQNVKVLRPIDFLLPQGSGLTVKDVIDFDPVDPDFLLPKDKEAVELIRLHKRAAHQVQVFWELWLSEYLTSLREKWRGTQWPKTVPKVGQIVIVHEDELPKSCWKTAIILELISERTAVIKMCPGGHITRRAVQHLYPLEIESDLGPNQEIVSPDKSESDQLELEEAVEPPTPIEAPRRSKRKPKLLRHPEFVYELDKSDFDDEGYIFTAVNKPKSKKLPLFRKALIGLMFLLFFISQSFARPLLSSTLVVQEVVNLTKNLSANPVKVKTGKRKSYPVRRYRIKDRTKVTAMTTTESSTPSVVVTTPHFRIATTANLLNKSISKIGFVIDSAKPIKANIVAESKMTLAKSITTAPRSWTSLILSQTPRPAITSITQSYESVKTTARPFQLAKVGSVVTGLRAEKLKSSKSVNSQVTDAEVNGRGNFKKVSTLDKSKQLSRVLNLSMSELSIEDSLSQRENKRRDLTRPVYIPGQTYHPDELQKIAFSDPKTKQQYYFCKKSWLYTLAYPKRGTTVP